MTDDVKPETVSVTVELLDGRKLEITGMDPEAAIDWLAAQGVTPGTIKQTVHVIRGILPRLNALRAERGLPPLNVRETGPPATLPPQGAAIGDPDDPQ